MGSGVEERERKKFFVSCVAIVTGKDRRKTKRWCEGIKVRKRFNIKNIAMIDSKI